MGAAHTLDKSLPAPTKAQWSALCADNQKLKQELEIERSRISKLRRYIVGLNQPSKAPAETHGETTSPFATAIGLRTLAEQQGDLLEKLYNEYTEQQEQIDRVNKLNKQLLVANDKLRRSMLEFKKRARSCPDTAKHEVDLTLSERFQKQSAESIEEVVGQHA